MAEFLEEQAKKEGRKAQDLLVMIVDNYRRSKQGPHRKSMAPDSYLIGD
jgi:hypothetical protein